MIDRKCPVDGATLVEVEYQGVVVDQCPKCRGIFCDKGELETIVERAGRPLAIMRSKHKKLTRTVITNMAMTKQNTDHRPCPIDGAGMEHFDRFGVAVDICPLCEGVWLDAGELQMIISLAACYLVHEAAAEAEAIRTKPIPMGASPRSGKSRLSPQQQAIADRNFVEALTQRSRHREKGVYELNLATSTPFSVRRQLKQQEQEMQSLRRSRLKKGSSLASRAFTAYETADGAGEAYDMLSSIFEALQ